MSLLYNSNPTIKLIVTRINGKIQLEFESNIGKHNLDEPIDFYNLTPERLIDILQERDDYTDQELEDERDNSGEPLPMD